MNDNSQEKPKIIVDEDWKTQVQAEREELKKKSDAASTSDSAAESEEATELPPASFGLLVTSLATQAMACMGQIPDPVEKKTVVQLFLAKHHIDTLDVLQQKTQGNLTADEAAMLENVLHQLRMLYVSVQSGAAEAPTET